MATNFFWSDLHLGHGNIITLSQRPFPDVEAMNRQLIDNARATVSAEDTLWFLGDVVMGSFAETIKLMAEIPGRKILVAGNHDRVFPGSRKHAKFLDTYRQAGFEEIHLTSARTVIGGVTVQLNHFPYSGDSRDEERYSEWRPVDRGGWLVHGHVHERWRQRGRQINIGVDAWAGTPVSEHTLAQLIQAGPQNLDRLPW